jgi:hypothetical protein
MALGGVLMGLVIGVVCAAGVQYSQDETASLQKTVEPLLEQRANERRGMERKALPESDARESGRKLETMR